MTTGYFENGTFKTAWPAEYPRIEPLTMADWHRLREVEEYWDRECAVCCTPIILYRGVWSLCRCQVMERITETDEIRYPEEVARLRAEVAEARLRRQD